MDYLVKDSACTNSTFRTASFNKGQKTKLITQNIHVAGIYSKVPYHGDAQYNIRNKNYFLTYGRDSSLNE